MKLLVAVAVVLASCAHALRVNAVQWYTQPNCTGAINSTFLASVSGQCIKQSESTSVSLDCTEIKNYTTSSICEGDFNAIQASCITQSTTSNNYVCKEYATDVVQLTPVSSCNSTDYGSFWGFSP